MNLSLERIRDYLGQRTTRRRARRFRRWYNRQRPKMAMVVAFVMFPRHERACESREIRKWFHESRLKLMPKTPSGGPSVDFEW